MRLVPLLLLVLFVIHAHAIRGSAKVIYGEDGRTDQYELPPFDKALGDSTVIILQGYDILHYNEDGSWTATNTLPAQSMWNLCPDERFLDQPIFFRGMVFCSGFLISSDPGWVGTAAHCTEGILSSYIVVFGFEMTSNSTSRLDFRAEDVYKVKSVVAAGKPSGDIDDYGVLELDRPVKHHTPYTKINPKMEVDDKLILIGHPMGMPKKTDRTGSVLKTKEDMIRGDVDSYAGSSGSPVFDAHGLLVGILTGGSDDFVYEHSEGNCRESNICPGPEGCNELGEFIVPICVLIQNPNVQKTLSHLDCNSEPATDEYFTYELGSASRSHWALPLIALLALLMW